jgi:antitoxin (DNA-binding transcriptional repressor) of toxin-antitoxin stability system
MKTIGIRSLKATLSHVLRDVQRGDVYLVTDRGRVVAELHAPGGGVERVVSREERAFADLAASGHLRVAERPALTYRRTGLKSPGGLAKRLLDEERGE